MHLYDLINTGPFDDALYRQLAAVVASIFARMAVRERSATGRARRVGSEVQEPVALEAFVRNGLVPPRILVATLVRTACSHLTSARLITIERARVQQSSPIAHVLARGRDEGAVGGEQQVLVRFDALGLCWLPEERLRKFPSGARCLEQYDALKLDGFGRAPLEHLLVVQALEPTLQCAKCEFWRPELAFPGTWTCETKEAPRAKGPPSLCHFCLDAGHKAPKVNRGPRGPRGHPNTSNAPPALPPAVQLAVEQSFPATQEDAEAEAALIQVLIARRTVGRQGGASSDQHDLMRRALLLCRGDREAALGADESAGTTRKKGSAAIAIVKRAGHVCSLLVHEPELVDVYSSLEPERVAGASSSIARAAAYWRAAAAGAVAAALAALVAVPVAVPMLVSMQDPMQVAAQGPVPRLLDGMPIAEATPLVAPLPGRPIQGHVVPIQRPLDGTGASEFVPGGASASSPLPVYNGAGVVAAARSQYAIDATLASTTAASTSVVSSSAASSARSSSSSSSSSSESGLGDDSADDLTFLEERSVSGEGTGVGEVALEPGQVSRHAPQPAQLATRMLAAFEGTSPVSGDAAEEEALPNSLAAEAEGEESDLDEDEDDDDDDDEDELDACALHGDLLEKADEDRLAEEEEEAAAGALSSAHVPPAEDEVLILPGEASIDTRSVEVLEVPMVIISAADAQGLVHVQATEVVRGPEGVQEGTMPAVPSTSPLPPPPLPAGPSPPLPVQWAPVVTLDAPGGLVASGTAASSSAAPLSPELAPPTLP